MWLETFKLGNEGEEIFFAANPSELNFVDEELSETDRNLFGDKRKTVRKVITRITITYPNCEVDEVNQIKSIKNDVSAFKRLLVNDEFKIVNEIRISEDKNTLYIAPSSRTEITVEGIWIATDKEHTGTNFWIGGTFSEETKKITLAQALPEVNTRVIINYFYQGWNVDFVNLNVQYSAEKPMLADISAEFEGI